MAKRHPKAAGHLDAAIGQYDKVIEEAQAIGVSEEEISSSSGRQEMIAHIKNIIEFEGQAVTALEKAAQGMASWSAVQ